MGKCRKNTSKYQILKLREKFGGRIDQVILFGSYARKGFQEESDIDVLVIADRVKLKEF